MLTLDVSLSVCVRGEEELEVKPYNVKRLKKKPYKELAIWLRNTFPTYTIHERTRQISTVSLHTANDTYAKCMAIV